MTNKFQVFVNRYSQAALYVTYTSIAVILIGFTLDNFTSFAFAGKVVGAGIALFMFTMVMMLGAFGAIVVGLILHIINQPRRSSKQDLAHKAATDTAVRSLRNMLGMLHHPRSHEVMSPDERAAVEKSAIATRKMLEPASLDQDFIDTLTRQGIDDITVVSSEDGKRLLFSYDDGPRPDAG